MEHKYSDAKDIAIQYSNVEIRNVANNLADILNYAGQKDSLIAIPMTNNESLCGFLAKLAYGYQILYTNSYTVEPFEYFNQALLYAEKEGDNNLKKLALLAILEVYNFEVSQSNENCLLYLEKFRQLIETPIDEYHYNMNLLLYNLRNIFLKVNLNQDFVMDFEVLMTNFEEGHPFWPKYYSTVGVLNETFGEIEKAIEFHQSAIKLIDDEPFLRYIKFRSYIRLSEIYRRSNLSNDALVYIDSSRAYVDLADTTRSKYYLNMYAAHNHAALQNFQNAYESLKTASDLKTKLDYHQNSLEISRLNTKYQTAEKEKQILLEKQKKKQNRNIAMGLGGLLIFGTLIFLLIQKNTTKKRQLAEQMAQLEQQKVTTLLKEQELVSIDAMIEGQEKERQKVANELHDDLGSLMATVKLHFDNVKVDKKDPALKSAQDLLEKAYQKIRGIAHAKNSGVMTNQGLLPAVKKMAKTITETNALEVSVEDFGLGERMENSLELTIFRILQELVANIIKHAEASQASIQFTQHEDKLNIIVEDNGKGFDMSAIQRDKSGMGLGTIEKRIEHLEGSFTVDSVIGSGTSVLIDIPI